MKKVESPEDLKPPKGIPADLMQATKNLVRDGLIEAYVDDGIERFRITEKGLRDSRIRSLRQ